MKKIILLIILTIFGGCTGNQAKYSMALKVIEQPKELVQIGVKKVDFSKSLVLNSYLYSPNSINLVFKNKTNKPVEIVWSESSINNNVIFKDGMKYKNAGTPPAKTILFPKSLEKIKIYDSEKVDYSSGWNIERLSEEDFPIKLVITVKQSEKKEMYLVEIDKKREEVK